MRILIVGLGSIAKKHISAIREIDPHAVIYALRSSGNVEIYDEVINIFSINDVQIKPDFIIISNPTNLHEEAIIQSLTFNCPLFIEKPVLSNTRNAGVLLREISKRKIKTYVACNMRFNPALVFLKSHLEIEKPFINEVNIYCGSHLPDWRPGRDFRKIYSANENMGGGVHLDLIHELDYCIWLFGMPLQVKSVKRKVSSLAIDAIDYANFALSYTNFTVNIILNYYRKDAKRQLEIVSSDDTLTVDLLKNKICSNVSDKVLFEEPFKMSDTFVRQLKYFIDHSQQNGEFENNFQSGVRTLKIALND